MSTIIGTPYPVDSTTPMDSDYVPIPDCSYGYDCTPNSPSPAASASPTQPGPVPSVGISSPATPTTLPVTGGDAFAIAVLGVGLLILGMVILLARHRRTERGHRRA